MGRLDARRRHPAAGRLHRGGGLGLADSARIALRCRDEPLAHWAAVICALSIGIVAQCFGHHPFISPGGVQFWILAAALHAA